MPTQEERDQIYVNKPSQDELEKIRIIQEKIEALANKIREKEQAECNELREQIAALKEENSGLAGAAIEKPPYKEELLKEWKWAKKQIAALTEQLEERMETVLISNIENKRLRQIVIDCYVGWPDEVLQKALRGEEAKDGC